MFGFLSSPNDGSRNRYRSRRSVTKSSAARQNMIVTNWTKTKVLLVGVATVVLATTTFLPIILMETSTKSSFKAPQSLHRIIERSGQLEKEYQKKGVNLWNKAKDTILHHKIGDPHTIANAAAQEQDSVEDPDVGREHINSNEDPPPPKESNAKAAEIDLTDNPLARGVAGLPIDQTPALVGAKPGKIIECDENIDDIVYWNDPQGTKDQEFASPFQTPDNYYLTFEPDPGGWNNIRMSMEIFFVIAAATGRTLVLPPKSPFYLLGHGKKHVRSFGDFFPLNHPALQNRVKVITMEEFFEREGKALLGLSEEEFDKLKPTADVCLHNDKASDENCIHLYEVLRQKGHQPDMEGARNCFIFDQEVFETGEEPSDDVKNRVARFCSNNRQPIYYGQDLHQPQLVHWNGWDLTYRVMTHFYTFIYFTDSAIDNHFKRFVRDFLHYIDQIFCAAGKIVHSLNQAGPWSSMHIRRGDLQYKQVKIPAEQWYENTKEIWHDDETIFIATDERNKTWFDPIAKHNKVKFLDDYFEYAKLGDLDPYYLGMVDTIVASHGRAIAGTFFSTFTGYINRLRGYLGHSMKNSWYSFLPKKNIMQEWTYPFGNRYPREWPIAWVGIDGDEVLEIEPVLASEGGEITVKQTRPDSVKPDVQLSDLSSDVYFEQKDLARGIAGRPMSETPALVGGKRGHLQCRQDIDSMAYWNDPQGTRDQEFVSPFRVEKGDEKYITFTVDRGGWNNVRMSMEIIFVFAAITGRTLVLPPKEPLYRLSADTENKFRGFADFFPLYSQEFKKRVKIISTEEFVKKEGGPGGKAPTPESMRVKILHSMENCDKREKSPSWCGHIANYLGNVTFPADIRAQDQCVVFDEDIYNGKEASAESKKSIDTFCGERIRKYWTASEFKDPPVLHFRAGEKQWRLLTHFYGLMHFTDPAIDNYAKRFVRDFLHYHDQIYCAAAKIVKALQVEAIHHGWPVDSNGAGGYSSMHIRRGEFQYKRVKIPAEEWYENTKEVWKPNELIYIATDERNKTFFDPIAKHHPIRFLDDYMELANLKTLDPNYFGMIDTIVASRSRAFAGTWFSTFTGYINRMRGYHGLTMKDSWYSFLERKTKLHSWENVDKFAYAWEWPDGWIGIDADTWPSKEVF